MVRFGPQPQLPAPKTCGWGPNRDLQRRRHSAYSWPCIPPASRSWTTGGRCWRSPTAVARGIPTSWAGRTRWRRSPTPRALGYRYLETDVHLTHDGVLVAFHDALLDRVTDGVGSIADLDTTALAQVRVAGEPVPTLAEVVEAFPEARFNLDLKADAAVEPLAAFVRERGLAGPGPGRVVLVASAAPVPDAGRPAGADLRRPRRGGGVRRPPGPGRPPAGPPGGRSAGPPPGPVAARHDPPAWYAAPTRAASRCTSGPSTTPTRCAPCSTAGSTA